MTIEDYKKCMCLKHIILRAKEKGTYADCPVSSQMLDEHLVKVQKKLLKYELSAAAMKLYEESI